MREREIEKYLRKRVAELGGLDYKWTSPGNAGVPDRIVVFPGGSVHFIELKAPGKKPTALQARQMSRLGDIGASVRVIDSKEGVEEFIRAEWGCGSWLSLDPMDTNSIV